MFWSSVAALPEHGKHEPGELQLCSMFGERCRQVQALRFRSADRRQCHGRHAGGSSGWQAPEQLVSRAGGVARQGRAVDVFSAGLLLHFCLTAGRHPAGETYERDANILQVDGVRV